jgi:hypothetical protein
MSGRGNGETVDASSSSFPALKRAGQELAPDILQAYAESVATASSGLVPRPFSIRTSIFKVNINSTIVK